MFIFKEVDTYLVHGFGTGFGTEKNHPNLVLMTSVRWCAESLVPGKTQHHSFCAAPSTGGNIETIVVVI